MKIKIPVIGYILLGAVLGCLQGQVALAAEEQLHPMTFHYSYKVIRSPSQISNQNLLIYGATLTSHSNVRRLTVLTGVNPDADSDSESDITKEEPGLQPSYLDKLSAKLNFFGNFLSSAKNGLIRSCIKSDLKLKVLDLIAKCGGPLGATVVTLVGLYGFKQLSLASYRFIRFLARQHALRKMQQLPHGNALLQNQFAVAQSSSHPGVFGKVKHLALSPAVLVGAGLLLSYLVSKHALKLADRKSKFDDQVVMLFKKPSMPAEVFKATPTNKAPHLNEHALSSPDFGEKFKKGTNIELANPSSLSAVNANNPPTFSSIGKKNKSLFDLFFTEIKDNKLSATGEESLIKQDMSLSEFFAPATPAPTTVELETQFLGGAAPSNGSFTPFGAFAGVPGVMVRHDQFPPEVAETILEGEVAASAVVVAGQTAVTYRGPLWRGLKAFINLFRASPKTKTLIEARENLSMEKALHQIIHEEYIKLIEGLPSRPSPVLLEKINALADALKLAADGESLALLDLVEKMGSGVL